MVVAVALKRVVDVVDVVVLMEPFISHMSGSPSPSKSAFEHAQPSPLLV